MKIGINFNRRNRIIEVKKLSTLGTFIGLMFKTRRTKKLLFDFHYDARHAIHSYFVFFKFLAVWLDKNNNVIDVCLVRPFTTIIKPRVVCRKLIEIPLNEDNNEIIDFFVGKGKI